MAVAAAADGVHLTSAEGSLTPADVRRLYASAGLPEPVVSVSCHTLNEVAQARAAKPTLILFGPVFEKVALDAAAPQPVEALISEGSGLNLLHLACAAATPVPVLALGGVIRRMPTPAWPPGPPVSPPSGCFRGISATTLPVKAIDLDPTSP